jgi:glycine/D-amino acid oxidase-like deaminating enzyme
VVGEQVEEGGAVGAGSGMMLVVVHGAGLAGSSTQAQLLSQRYSLPVTTMDDLLFEAADLEQPAAGAAPGGEAGGAAAAAVPQKGASPVRELPAFDQEISDLLYSKVSHGARSGLGWSSLLGFASAMSG